MSAAEFDPDKSPEALGRAAQERAVREFFAKAEAADPAKAAAVFAKFPTLTDRQMRTRQGRESEYQEDARAPSKHSDPLHRGAQPTREGILSGAGDRRTDAYRSPLYPKPKPYRIKGPVGRPRGNPEEQAERKRQYNRDRRVRVGNDDTKKR